MPDKYGGGWPPPPENPVPSILATVEGMNGHNEKIRMLDMPRAADTEKPYNPVVFDVNMRRTLSHPSLRYTQRPVKIQYLDLNRRSEGLIKERCGRHQPKTLN